MDAETRTAGRPIKGKDRRTQVIVYAEISTLEKLDVVVAKIRETDPTFSRSELYHRAVIDWMKKNGH